MVGTILKTNRLMIELKLLVPRDKSFEMLPVRRSR